MRKILLLSFLFLSFMISAQVVTTSPAIPTADDLITIYFHAEQGSGGLADYSGDIYAHIGVITEKSADGSDWKYVKAEWSENIEACKMTKEDDNLYSLVLSPDIYTYFGCPTDEKILQIALVFRSSTGSPEGKDTGGNDIYVDIYEAGLNLSFERNVDYVLDNPGASISFTANASLDAELSISIDGAVKSSLSSTSTISYTESFAEAGDYLVVATATLGEQVVKDSIAVCILATPVSASLPEGVEDGINYNCSSSVTFVLYAPYKSSVLLIGDFNDWKPSNAYLLNQDGNYWWIRVDGLTPGEEYAFQYLVDQEIAIADPYSEKVLDPWNDKYISSSTYPDLKAYPEAADGIVGLIQPGAEEYQWQVTDFTPPLNDKLVIYELLVRDFVASQDIKDVTKELDYLDELGITAIELMPVNEFEGNNSWGYNPSFFFAFDKNYGTKDDYKAFIDSCHARGIAVIMDIALNHAYYQCPLVQLYFDADAGDWGQPSAQNPWFNTTSPNTEYSWGADFDHDSPFTEQFVDRVLEHWLTEYKVDGFRLDFTKGFTNTSGNGWAYDASRIENLKRIYDQVKSVNEDAYVILEHFTENSEETELANYGMMIWGNNNNAYMQSAMGYDTDASISGVSHLNKGWNYPNLVAYQESHDEERMMYKNTQYGNGNSDLSYNIKDTITALKRQELAAVFFLTVPGPKMIWQFGELGYHYSIDACTDGVVPTDNTGQCRTSEKPIRWDFFYDENRKAVYDVYSKLNKLRAKYQVFSSWNHSITETGMNGFTKRINIYDESADVAIIGNFDVVPQWVEPNFSSTGTWYEFFSGEEINVTSTDMGIELQPGEYKLYSTIKMSVEQGEVNLPVEELQSLDFVVFPNPADDLIFIKADQSIISLHLYSLSGKCLRSQRVNSNSGHLSVQGIPSGTYLLQVNGDDFSNFKRVLIR